MAITSPAPARAAWRIFWRESDAASVVTEQVFNLNGIGRLFVLAVQNQDYTLTQALVMLVVTVFVLTNFAVDMLYAWLDPRIRYE